jgi:hypothetical protein
MGFDHRFSGGLIRTPAHLAARLYGARISHLIVVLASLALGFYVVLLLGVDQLFNPTVWWQSIAVWFAVAVIGHDLILFPLYAAADWLLLLLRRAATNHASALPRPAKHLPLTNYLRIPTLAAALLLMMFLPGIIEQGAATYHAATGLTQTPYLSRWLMLTAVFYLASALWYAVKTVWQQRRSTKPAATSSPVTTRPPTHDSAAVRQVIDQPATATVLPSVDRVQTRTPSLWRWLLLAAAFCLVGVVWHAAKSRVQQRIRPR